MSFVIVTKRQLHDYIDISPLFHSEFQAKERGYNLKKIQTVKFHFDNGCIIKERFRANLNDFFNIEIREHIIDYKDIEVYVDDTINLLTFEIIK